MPGSAFRAEGKALVVREHHMIKLYCASQRNYANFGWGKAYRLFSSHNFYDPANTHFGSILAVNDYTLLPGLGYDMHPHVNLEQIFIVIKGELEHKDALGNTLTLNENSVQHITAGSGYARSIRTSGKAPARYIGIWLAPKTENLVPKQETRSYTPDLWENAFFTLASDTPGKESAPGRTSIVFNSASTVYRAAIRGRTLDFPVAEGCNALLYLINGEATCNGKPMRPGDHARVTGEETLSLHAPTFGDYVLVTMGGGQ